MRQRLGAPCHAFRGACRSNRRCAATGDIPFRFLLAHLLYSNLGRRSFPGGAAERGTSKVGGGSGQVFGEKGGARLGRMEREEPCYHPFKRRWPSRDLVVSFPGRKAELAGSGRARWGGAGPGRGEARRGAREGDPSFPPSLPGSSPACGLRRCVSRSAAEPGARKELGWPRGARPLPAGEAERPVAGAARCQWRV